jgi:hypothetical protein
MGFKSKLVVATIAAAMLGVGCSKSSSGGGGGSSTGSSALTLTGSLSLTGGTSSGAAMSMALKHGASTKATDPDWIKSDVTAYRIACATFETIPAACGEAVGADGSFSVTCSGFTGKAFGCFVYNTTTFANYPIVFNVQDEEKSSLNLASATTVTSTIVLDLDTGVASAESTVAAPTAITEVAVDSTTLGYFDGVWRMNKIPWATIQNSYTATEKEQLAQARDWHSCDGQPQPCTPAAAGTPEAGYNIYANEMSGNGNSANAMQVYFHPTLVGTDNKMGVWESPADYALCGSKESDFSFNFSDGSGGKADVVLDFAAQTDRAGLKTELQTKLATVINQWFPVLNQIGDSSAAGDYMNASVTCKYAVDIPFEFWNDTPERVAACEADTTNCKKSGMNDVFGALQAYKWGKLFSAANATTDGILGLDLTNAVKPASSTLLYGEDAGWDPATQKPIINPLPNGTTVSEVDLGGCIKWSMNGPPTIVPIGEYFKMYRNGEEVMEKCGWSERRLLYQVSDAATAHFVVNSIPYKEARPYVEDGGVKFMTFQKVCQTTAGKYNDGANDTQENGAGDDSTEWERTDYQSFPVAWDTTSIETDIESRFGGQQAQERNEGLKFEVIYRMLADGDGGGGGDSIQNDQMFYGWDRKANGGMGQPINLTCANIKSPASGQEAATWDKIGALMDDHNPWQISKVLSCAMIGIAAGKYDAQSGVPNSTDVPRCTAPGASIFCDDNNNNSPDVFDSLKANSCLPRFQFTPVCDEDTGRCDMKMVCNDLTSETGGCENAEPSKRMAIMSVEGLAAGKFAFFEKNERYEFFYNPDSNTSQKCTRTEYMKISNVDAVSGTAATGDTTRLMFERSEAKACEGESGEVQLMPKLYFDFEKI